MEREFKVEVKVNSFTPPRVYLGTRRVTLGSGNTRKGNKTIKIAGVTVQAKLKFSAPVQTDWTFKVKEESKDENGKTKETVLLDKSGQSDTVDFEFTETLTLATPKSTLPGDTPPIEV